MQALEKFDAEDPHLVVHCVFDLDASKQSEVWRLKKMHLE